MRRDVIIIGPFKMKIKEKQKNEAIKKIQKIRNVYNSYPPSTLR